MTTLRMLVGLGFAWLIGWLFLALALPRFAQRRAEIWLRLPFALGAGLGLSSLSYFLWMPLSGSFPWGFALGEILLAGSLILLRLLSRRRETDLLTENNLPSKPPVFLSLAFYGVTAWALLNFFLRSFTQQHGNWDAWSIWNLAARFLYRGGEYWRNAFSPVLFHGDYPLLVPANVARLWVFAGKESLYASWLVALVYFAGTILLLIAAIQILRGNTHALVGGLMLISATAFTVYGASQVADVPAGFYLLAAGVAILMSDHYPAVRPRWLALAGFFGSLAAWTKNEGWLICAALAGCLMLVGWVREDRKAALRSTLIFAAGAAPVLLFVAVFKIVYAPPNDLIAGQGSVTLARLVDPPSYLTVARGLLYQTFRMDVKRSTPLIMLFLFGTILGLRREALQSSGFAILTGALLVVLSGYFFIFMISPHPLLWHLEDPPPRLFLHLWPTAILLFTLALPSQLQPAEEKWPS